MQDNINANETAVIIADDKATTAQSTATAADDKATAAQSTANIAKAKTDLITITEAANLDTMQDNINANETAAATAQSTADTSKTKTDLISVTSAVNLDIVNHNNYVESATDYNATDDNDYIVFTDLTTAEHTCTLGTLSINKVLHIRRDNGAYDLIVNAPSISIGGSCQNNYHMTGDVRSMTIICTGTDAYQIISLGA